ncbi:class I SAM-dependent methyltransferase [Methylorubrum podarium]|uniref:class I SAM-dependent methyltransferase n=1 Tax=Methylorubrum podarium TaxID=200476 RepID=UPI001EE24290|nr:class I SAM-dependent methyltransferase [Methylorubrum podarium]
MANGRGLEFGPANNPIELPTDLSITYIDYDKRASAGLTGAVPIDYAWAGSGSLAVVLGRRDYDFAIAVQVAQYVPNLLGWFRGIHGVLRPRGVLNLSLPDRRLMFDAARFDSTIAELVEADVHGYDRPSVRQIFTHTYQALAIEPVQIWNGRNPNEAPLYCGEDALALAYDNAINDHRTGAYRSCHCWAFTPLSFLDVIEAATRLKLFPFVLNDLTLPTVGGFEFYVSMRRDEVEDPRALIDKQISALHYIKNNILRVQREARLLFGT